MKFVIFAKNRQGEWTLQEHRTQEEAEESLLRWRRRAERESWDGYSFKLGESMEELTLQQVREALEHVWTDATHLPASDTRETVCYFLQSAAERLDIAIEKERQK